MQKKIIYIFIFFLLIIPFIVSAQENGWVTENNETYYYKDGEMYKGILELEDGDYLLGYMSGKLYRNGLATTPEGKVYLTDKEGKIKYNFQEIDGETYFFDKNGMYKGVLELEDGNYLLGYMSGKLYRDGLATTPEGKVYLTDKDGKIEYGYKIIDKETYYFDKNGMYKGILETENGNYLFGYMSGKLYRNGLATTPDGRVYLTDKDGKIEYGYKEIDKETYYFDKNGMYKGILETENGNYLFGYMSGKLYRNGLATTPDGRIYLTDKDGKIEYGFKEIDKETYYFDKNGMYKGILETENGNYLFGYTSGKLYRDGFATTPDGSTYLTDKDGKIQVGLIELNDNKYLFAPDGKMQYGIQQVGEEKYYFSHADGSMQYGIQKENGNAYLFGVYSGKLYYGWATTPDGNKYYSNEQGILLNGVQIIDGKRYLLGVTSYKLYYGWARTPDGKIYYSNEEGIVQTGNQTINGNAYLFDDNGVLQTGWQNINGKTYYYYADGTQAKYVCKIGDKRYEFSWNGELQYSDVKVVMDVSYWQGDIDWDTVWKSDTIDAVILRMGYSTTEDILFETYIRELRRLKIPYSIYWFSYARNTNEAYEEAKTTISLFNSYGLNPSFNVYYDIEDWEYRSDPSINSYGVTKDDYEAIINTYINTLRDNGIGSKVYANSYFYNSRFNDNTRSQVEWIANYAVGDRPGNYRGWQYTSSGTIPGVSTKVDLSIFYW